jgi:hypothetical protein
LNKNTFVPFIGYSDDYFTFIGHALARTTLGAPGHNRSQLSTAATTEHGGPKLGFTLGQQDAYFGNAFRGFNTADQDHHAPAPRDHEFTGRFGADLVPGQTVGCHHRRAFLAGGNKNRCHQ